MCRLISATINGCEHAKHLGRMGGYCVGSRRPAIVRLRGGPKRLPEAWGSGSSSTFLNSYIRKSISPYADNRKLSDEYVPRCLRFGALGGDAAEAHIFDFDEFVDAVLGAFATEAGFLYAAEGGDFRGDKAAIDADDAVFEGFGDAPDAGDIAAVEIRCEAEFGVVGEGDGFGFGLEAEERGDGTKSFFTRNGHLRSHSGEHGGLKEAAAESVAMAADEDFCSLRLRVANVAFDFLNGGVVNEGALRGAGFEAGSGLQRLDRDGKLGGENVVHGVLHEQTVRTHAGLASVAVLRSDGAFDGGVQVGVVEDDEGRVAAEFQ